MIPPAGPTIPRWVWALAVCFLVAWNAFLAQYASPCSLTQAYDGAQYQLLARNRLAGNYHVGDQAHTVRDEGSHPMWRPGLVWLTEGLARLTGSVGEAAWILSAFATTLFEVTLLWLGWRCFGRVAWTILLVAMCLPFHWNAIFLSLAVGQGPEPWAAACMLAGWALFLKAADRRSIALPLAAGALLGAADWFRTGNVLLFAAPWMIFLVAAIIRKGRAEIAQCLTTLAGFVAMTVIGGLLVSSPVDKTFANLWGNLVEHDGLQIVQETELGTQTQYLGGLLLAPGTQETYYDYIVRASGTASLSNKRAQIVPLYLERLAEVIAGGFTGLRVLAGEWTLAFAIVAIGLALIQKAPALLTFAFAAGFLAHYFGPVVLLRGDKPTHYLFVALPMLVLIGAGGLATLIQLVMPDAKSPLPGESRPNGVAVMASLLLIPVIVLAVYFYRGGFDIMLDEHVKAQQDFADLDALRLEGKKVATRSMAWFADRNIKTVLFPYVRVSELEHYVLHHRLDGVLVRTQEKHAFFNTTPYESFGEFENGMRQSEVFGRPQTAGVWKWFPVRRSFRSE